MNSRERFEAFFRGEGYMDRLPVFEWAGWWDKTVAAWEAQGMPKGTDVTEYWKMDRDWHIWLPIRNHDIPREKSFGSGIIETAEDYENIKKYLYTDVAFDDLHRAMQDYVQNKSDRPCWITMEGFFWFPRDLLGIENHLYAFYDDPELILQINRDLCEFHKKCLEIVYSYTTPLIANFAEDMSYNNGPMCSREMYDQFILPFYKEIVPILKEHNATVMIDTDGNVEPLIPWFLDAGIEGVFPLERMAGVDVNRVRAQYPDFFMLGGFDKTVLHKGKEAIHAEFERLRPAIQSGRYLPTMDHQTPPDASLENYAYYRQLLEEYCTKYGARK
ncbi:MAG: hypothetical protein E7335_00770 [Clostridiales bacterium]|nr:hypothetical protein [Clostridiales bacterium]